jgi:hypothetical protein
MFSKMKLIIVSTISIVLILVLFVVPINAQFDFDCYLSSSIADEEIDGVIGSEWDDAGNYSSISIEPTGTAEVWTKHDGTYFYIAIQFFADSSNPWVGIQFGQSHMNSGADGAIFGNDRIGANEYRDISFGGIGSMSSDSNQDGAGAINVGASNLVTIELKKPLNSGDSAGSDINWNVNESYALTFLWDSNGGGSSGGSSSHTSSSQLNRTIFINPNAIPEFSALSISLIFVVIAMFVLIIKKSGSKGSI